MPITVRLLLLTIACAAVTPVANAHEVTLDGRRITLPIPGGYCLTSEKNGDAEIISRVRDGVGSNNRLLLLAAECGELQRARATPAGTSEGFEDYVTFSVVLSKGQLNPIDQLSREEFVRLVSKEISRGTAVEEGLKQGQERIRRLGAGIGSVENLGLVGVDKNAVYLGVGFVQATRDGGAIDRYLAVSGLSLIKGLRISISTYKRYKSESDLQVLIDWQQSVLAKVVAANPQ